jgi:transposase
MTIRRFNLTKCLNHSGRISKIVIIGVNGDHGRAVQKIKDSLPIQRGNVKLHNLQVLNAILYVAEQGCKWRGLPSRYGNWHSIYMRMNRWAKNGVLDRVFEKLQTEQIVRIKIEAFSLDSTSIKVHPDGTGALKKTDHRPSANPAADGTPRFIWLPRMLERL